METKKNWQDGVNLLLGLWVFVSPWIFSQPTAAGAGAAGSVMWNFWIVGGAVAIVALIALFAYQVWEEWVNALLGIWLLISLWLLGFSSTTALMWDAVVFGVLIAVVAGWTLVPTLTEKNKHS